MKRLLACLLLMALALSLTACGDWEEPQSDLYQTLADYYGADKTEDEPPVLTSFALPYLSGETADPITCDDGAQKTLGTLMYESLFALDPDFQPQSVLAESWTYDASKRTYTITLRSDVLFSDGAELTAKDVTYSINRARSSARYKARLADISSVSGSGKTVTIKLKNKNASFLSRLDVPIIKNGSGNRTFPIGTGPYYYLSDDTGRHLAQNPHWWQHKTLPLERVELVKCKDTDTVAYAFYAREIQLLMCDLTATGTANVYGSGDYTDAATTTMHYIGVNTANSTLSKAAVRRALHLGIDRQGCINAFLLGHGLAAQYPISPADPLYPDSLHVPYSPDNFDTAMAEAGYADGGKVKLTLLVNKENSFKVDAAKRIAEDLSRHDLQIKVKAVSWDQYLTALQTGEFDLYYGECRLTADWDMRSLIATGGSLNYGGYANADTDALLKAAMAAEGGDREAALLALCQQLQQECPILPICFKNVSVLLPAGAVETITPTAANPFYDLSSWQIDIEK